MSLKNLRNRIDKVDSEILKLLNKRAELTKEIGAYKLKNRKGVYVPDRERQVYQRLVKMNKGPLSEKSVRAIYKEIMSGALCLEKPIVIAYLGPQYTFTNLAALKKFGSSVDYVSCNNITDVFEEVEKERADYGVVPIENSTEGAVNHTLDMFIDSNLLICSEVYLDISHNLLSRESSLANIKKIYSNPQVFGQCRLWLESNMPNVEMIETTSTTKAAERAAKEKQSGCISSVLAAEGYGLRLICKSIQDSSYNVTRFLVIGKTIAKPTELDKTSIMFSLRDRVGGLHDMLVPFKKNGINLTKIESRPSKVRPWEYYFFVDAEGHRSSKKLTKSLESLKKGAAFIKILGSYPAGD
ncbi:MAG: prephenate dehydratase [Candidatus Omnitrophota bacterium]